MNALPMGVRVRVVSSLVEGVSLRGTGRMTDVGREAVTALLLRMGDGCERLHDARMRDLRCDVLELDEAWSFVFKKQGHLAEDDPAEYGDAYTWIAIDADTKLVPCFRVDKRSTAAAHAFAAELRARVVGKPQITSDGFKAYLGAIENSFGTRVNYAQISKEYYGDESDDAPRDDRRYSGRRVKRSLKRPITGTPDEARISTCFVERQNLTLRMGMRRFTRLTNAFSKRVKNLRAAVNLHFAHYNFCRVHMTLRVTPAMEAGLTDHVWTIEELVTAALAAEVAPPLALPTPPEKGARFGRLPSGDGPLPGQLALPGVL